MSKNYPNWNYEDWPWAKGSWTCYGSLHRNETPSLWYEGGFFIKDVNFIFPKSKYEGLTLSQMVKLHPKAVRLYLFHRNIYILPKVIDDLENVSLKQKSSLRRIVESYLTFDEINTDNPQLCSKTYKSHFDGYSILEIITEDPEYLPYVISHAKGRLMIDTQYLEELIENSHSSKVTSTLESCLKEIENILEEQKEAEEAYQREMDYLAEKEEMRWYENEGYREAFDNNPDAEWNID